MKRSTRLATWALCSAALLGTGSLLATGEGPGEGEEPAGSATSVDLTALDEATEPCDDFYQFACGGWLAANEIPADRSTWSRGFAEVGLKVTNILHGLLEKFAAEETPSSADAKLLGDYYGACMDEPVDSGDLARLMHQTRNLPSVTVNSDYVSNWLDNSRAKFELGWRPTYDLARLVEAAWSYQRAANDPRKVWYPG